MSRPKKSTVDYFPHYNHHGRVLAILESRYGNNGYSVFYKLLELLGCTDGHCYNCQSVDGWEYLLSRMNCEEDIVQQILDKLSDMSVIDTALWREKRIWMQSFVDSIEDAYSRRKDSLPVIPVLMYAETPLTGINDNISTERKGKERKLNKHLCAQQFEILWQAYPKKRDKQNSLKAFIKINPQNGTFEKMIEAIELQKQSDDWQKENGKYVPMPTTWLNGHRWEDEITTGKPVKGFYDNWKQE